MTASTDPAELLGLLQQTPLTRRTVLVSTLSVGFAAAVQPVTAQTLTTDTTGLEVGEVKIPTADGEIPAYRAMPAAAGPHATVLVVQEIFGVHEHIKDVCRRFAKQGYCAVAPELYALGRADVLAKGKEATQDLERLVALEAHVTRLVAEGAALGTRDLALDGSVLMKELGLPPGRQIGELLRALLEEVVENPALNTREKLLELARALAAKKPS